MGARREPRLQGDDGVSTYSTYLEHPVGIRFEIDERALMEEILK